MTKKYFYLLLMEEKKTIQMTNENSTKNAIKREGEEEEGEKEKLERQKEEELSSGTHSNLE